MGEARTQGLEISVRGRGHNVAGRPLCDAGFMIDQITTKGIEVDPPARTVRAQPVLNWGEFNLSLVGGIVRSPEPPYEPLAGIIACHARRRTAG